MTRRLFSGIRPAPIMVRAFLLISVSLAVSAQMVGAQVDYGADRVNSLPNSIRTVSGGKDDFNYLALQDHRGPSGVPLGGIGVGCFDYTPDGRINRILINNWHGADQSPVIHELPGTFLAAWSGGSAHLLYRSNKMYAGMRPARHTTYGGLFPTADCIIDAETTVHAWSGLSPHNIKDSSLPVAWFEVELRNDSAVPKPMAVALSWQDVLARGILDVRDRSMLPGGVNTAWTRGDAERTAEKSGRSFWTELPRVPTNATQLQVGALFGVCQSCAPLRTVVKTYQNLNNRVALLAEQTSGAEISIVSSYDVAHPEIAWDHFRQFGSFDGWDRGINPLYSLNAGEEHASAVAVHVTVEPHSHRTVRFMLAWWAPESTKDPTIVDPRTYFGTADYSRYYHRSFHSLEELVEYAYLNRARIHRETTAWHEPILSSTYPDWLKFKTINSAYTLYTNTILNRAGDFTVMEGGMGGLAGTMDQRLSAHPFYQKFFTSLDRSEMELFGHTPGRDGEILHFDGHYYLGLATRNGQTPVPDGSMLDNTGGWLIQLAKDWQQTGDTGWLRQFSNQIDRGLDYLRSRITSTNYRIPTGPTTYDDFWHPDLYAYNASTYPSVLKAGAVLERALGRPQKAKECENAAELSAQDAMRALWNGRFFAYGADIDGSHRRDDILFSGQLAGQFLSRYCCWGDLFPAEVVRASIISQLKTNIAATPDYYAPKVWLINENKPMFDPRRPGDLNADSTCWPFYLESYTAMAAIQAGYVDDGLSILKHIQLVNLRNGWTWSQSLWRPGELTYMTAPVSWFLTDVLAGAGLDVSVHTLYLAPVLREGEKRAVLPLFFPRFWATVTVDRAGRKVNFKVTRVFGNQPITLNRVVACPVGLPTTDAQTVVITPFVVKPGAELDLSAHWDSIMRAVARPSVLMNLAKSPFSVFQPSIIRPPLLTAASTKFVDATRVSMHSESPDATVYYSLDDHDPRSGGEVYHSAVKLTETTTVSAATRSGGKWSPVTTQTYVREVYRKPDLPNSAATSALFSAWNWRYYEGDWSTLPAFTTLRPVATGESHGLDLGMRHRDINFGVVFDGVLTVPKRGIYTFHLHSDDGSRLTIGGKDVLANDGIHDALIERTVTVPFEPGAYSLKLEYFQANGGMLLDLSCTPPAK